jgi:hypothetical protein
MSPTAQNAIHTPATAPEAEHLLRFATSVTTAASAEAVYDVLADVRTHLSWAGTEAPNKGFRLMTLDAPGGLAVAGTTFTSTGAGNAKETDVFHDRSTVTEAVPGRVFAFGTDARLERGHGETWLTHFEHRYELRPDGAGTRIDYTCDVVRGSYRPYWLHPFLRRMTRAMVTRMMTKHLANLARMAERRS